jgi:hypothetical protein
MCNHINTPTVQPADEHTCLTRTLLLVIYYFVCTHMNV